MDPGDTILAPRASDWITALHMGSTRHTYMRQIGDRDLHSRHGLDGDGLHAGYGPSEGHYARSRGPHGVADIRRIIDAPMACVLTGRGIVGDDFSVYRYDEANSCDGECEHHLSPEGQRIAMALRWPGGWQLTSVAASRESER